MGGAFPSAAARLAPADGKVARRKNNVRSAEDDGTSCTQEFPGNGAAASRVGFT